MKKAELQEAYDSLKTDYTDLHTEHDRLKDIINDNKEYVEQVIMPLYETYFMFFIVMQKVAPNKAIDSLCKAIESQRLPDIEKALSKLKSLTPKQLKEIKDKVTVKIGDLIRGYELPF